MDVAAAASSRSPFLVVISKYADEGFMTSLGGCRMFRMCSSEFSTTRAAGVFQSGPTSILGLVFSACRQLAYVNTLESEVISIYQSHT